jgi:hypothetical protein
VTRRTAVDVTALLAALVVTAVSAGEIQDVARGVRAWYSRQRLVAMLRPEPLANCTFARFGNAYDGGYVMCENLMADVRSAYSYGIEGRDEWGCAIAEKLHVPVHQYDCFVTVRPPCSKGTFYFHEECVGASATTSDGRVFDTLANQVSKNGHRGEHLLVKMDVEGAEWDSLRAAPAGVLQQIDQLVVEFHGIDDPRVIDTLVALKQWFVLAHVHFNNYLCNEAARPLPAFAYEVLFVNRAIARVDEHAPKAPVPNPADSPNNPKLSDCQPGW